MARMTRARGEHELAARLPLATSLGSGVAQRIPYRGYDILPGAEGTNWAAWILSREVPEGRISGQDSGAAAVAAAKAMIDQREGLRGR